MFVYYDESILTHVASIRGYFGLSSSYKENKKLSEYLKRNNPKKIYLLLIDGLGVNLINKKLSEDSFLRKHLFDSTSTVFPATTTAATTSIRNGKAPNENGWLGWSQYLKEVDDIIIPFRSRSFYDDKEYENCIFNKCVPVLTTEQELNKKGISATTVFPLFDEDGVEDFDELCNRLIYYSNCKDYKYIYAYWDKYDTYMHEYGPSSKICDSYLEHINYEIENLCDNLSPDTMLIVVADHGQVDIKRNYNLCGSEYDKYFSKKPHLEPRAMNFFIKKDLREEFEKKFKEEFSKEFVLLSHDQILETKLFGNNKNHPRFEEFVGDYIAIATSDMTLAYRANKNKVYFKGQHAGICEDELMIPVITFIAKEK